MLHGGQVDIPSIESINNSVKGWVELYLGRKDTKAQDESDALKALMTALCKTSEYMREVTESPDAKSYERDAQLSEIWRTASIKVRPYKAELSERCFFKGLYWTNNNRFTEEELVKRKLKLIDIEKEISSAIKSI
jgi:hypothetical protein